MPQLCFREDVLSMNLFSSMKFFLKITHVFAYMKILKSNGGLMHICISRLQRVSEIYYKVEQVCRNKNKLSIIKRAWTMYPAERRCP